MNEENYKGLKKQLETHSLDIASQLTILELAYKNEQQILDMKANEKMLFEEIDKWKIQYNRVFSHQAIQKLINSLITQQDKLIESNKKLDIKFRRGKITPEYLEGAIVTLKQISSKEVKPESQYTRLY